MAMGIGGNSGGPKQMGINVDLSKIPEVECIRCKYQGFMMTGKIKMVSPIQSPSGKWDMAVNAEWRCMKCGWVFMLEEWQQHQATELIKAQKGAVKADG